eukprot:SAG31_NODE_34451_length_332_cov_5.193133_1_plen_42_part_10
MDTIDSPDPAADSRMAWYHDIRSRRGGRPRGSLTAAAVGLAA